MTDEEKLASLVLRPFKSVEPYRFGMSRAECVEAFGPPERSKFNGTYYVENRGAVEVTIEKEKLNNVVVFAKLGGDMTFDGRSVFDPETLEWLRSTDPAHVVHGSFEHFPKLGLVVAGMGKRRTQEGPLASAFSRGRYKLMSRLGSV